MEEKTWKRIVKGEMLPTNSIIRPIDGGLPNIAGSCVTVGQDCYYLSVDDVCELLKDLPLETETETKKRNETTIIKKLIGLVKETELIGEENRTSLLDWLEKQGTPAKLSEEEQNRFAKGVLTSCAVSFIDYLDAHKYDGKMCVSNGECEDIENAFHNAMWDKLHRYYCKYIEKQGEQNPVWSEEDEAMLNFICANIPFSLNGRMWLKDLKERVQPQPKPAWSEEDEVKMREIISYLVKKKSRETDGYAIFLKSLKFRLLSPSMREFDKEEGSIIDHLIAICDDAMCYDTFAGCSKKDIEKYKSFLTYLKFWINPQPQTTWKPSDEQMKVLDVAIKSSHLTTAEYDGLVKLREQLKKL